MYGYFCINFKKSYFKVSRFVQTIKYYWYKHKDMSLLCETISQTQTILTVLNTEETAYFMSLYIYTRVNKVTLYWFKYITKITYFNFVWPVSLEIIFYVHNNYFSSSGINWLNLWFYQTHWYIYLHTHNKLCIKCPVFFRAFFIDLMR